MDNKDQLQIDDTLIGSTYAQVVGVTVTDIDVTLEFIYVNPRVKTKANVVSRVTLPRQAGEELAKAIVDTIKNHEDKKKGTKNG